MSDQKPKRATAGLRDVLLEILVTLKSQQILLAEIRDALEVEEDETDDDKHATL